METIILILLYVLSVIIARYVHIKYGFTETFHLIICLIPIINILGLFTVLMIRINELLYSKKITDWFFGIKKD